MATRSRIAIENQDRTVTSIYCHFDGYLSHNGEILQNHYSDRSKVYELIALGDISVLENDTDETIAYHRDRGEEFNQTEHKDVEDFFTGYIEEYGYLFTIDNKWLVSKGVRPVANLFVALEGEDVL